MKRNIWLLALFGVLLWGQVAYGQDFYVIPVGGVGTRINAVPMTILVPGFYYLGANLTHTGTTNAITINADNVTLDLLGFSLTHTGAVTNETGILLNGRTNVEIRNGTVTGFYAGIQETGTGNKHRVINVRAVNNGNVGIALSGINHLVKGCNCCNDISFGIFMGNANCIISDCIASNNNSYGIYLSSGIISNCIAANNGDLGIFLNGPGSVLGNTAFLNVSHNFYLGNVQATSILVDRNSAFGLNPNYYSPTGTTGVVITANNSGTP